MFLEQFLNVFLLTLDKASICQSKKKRYEAPCNLHSNDSNLNQKIYVLKSNLPGSHQWGGVLLCRYLGDHYILIFLQKLTHSF